MQTQINPKPALILAVLWIAAMLGVTGHLPIGLPVIGGVGPPVHVEHATFLLRHDGTPTQFSPENRPYQDLLNDVEVIQALTNAAGMGSDGKTPDYRIWEDTRKSTDAPWDKITARPIKEKYWFYGSNKTRWTEGPLPKDKPTLLKLINAYKDK